MTTAATAMATAGPCCRNHYAARTREEREDEHNETDEENKRAGHTR